MVLADFADWVKMKLPEYVTKDEVRRVCRELKIRDWTKLKKSSVTSAEAKKILAAVPKACARADPAPGPCCGAGIRGYHAGRAGINQLTGDPDCEARCD